MNTPETRVLEPGGNSVVIEPNDFIDQKRILRSLEMEQRYTQDTQLAGTKSGLESGFQLHSIQKEAGWLHDWIRQLPMCWDLEESTISFQGFYSPKNPFY